ncbi:hypothetical protein CO178_02200 [candidate division WWE3 bacterium CG_4_9_14_3_um_filter_34_6]|uniref:Uncharacterized protein n=1 Tax=candidate division WWE3 bacterium CG_4_9_14_3_um_filter_34_6 TaxID=1975079 RepID=A0A2M7X2M6_UNCKA|nr:MAG: hypothetical protein CO178_02200 [candidate division WWE3 bacterium CG_4_9_14_3_um_filter_34_6]
MDKSHQKYIPALVFLITVLFGGIIVFVAGKSVDNKGNTQNSNVEKSNVAEGNNFAEDNNVMGVAIENDVTPGSTNRPPLCLSFSTTAEGEKDSNGQYLDGSTFSFDVTAQDLDVVDKVNAVIFTIFNSQTKESVEKFTCTLDSGKNAENVGPECLAFKYSKNEAPILTSSLTKYVFPNEGKYYVKAEVISSDGTSTMCKPSSKADE